MEINCTLFIQCFNFGIAYIVLDRFVFKPVFACIMQERARHEEMQKAISRSQEVIGELELKRSHAWKQGQKGFKSHLATIPYMHERAPVMQGYDYSSPTDEQVRVEAQRMHDFIMKKVSNEFK